MTKSYVTSNSKMHMKSNNCLFIMDKLFYIC